MKLHILKNFIICLIKKNLRFCKFSFNWERNRAKLYKKVNANKKDDTIKNAKVTALDNQKREDLDALESLKCKEKKSKQRKFMKDVDERLTDVYKKQNVKNVSDFDKINSKSIESIVVKKNSTVKVTTRFMHGKMFMFSKVSVKSFVYNITDAFYFLIRK